MDRRKFLKGSIPVSAGILALNGISIRSLANSSLLNLIASSSANDRVLVIIQLNGGNDGLNTVIPLDQYTNLSAARSNILIDETKVLPLVPETGLHPSMVEMQQLFINGKLNVVQNVGYDSPNFSHFRSTDIWLTASDSNQTLTSGWLGRYLDTQYPNFPTGYPNTQSPDPPALQIGSSLSLALLGPTSSMGMAITNPTSFYQLISGGVDVAPNTPAGHELTFIRQVTSQTQLYANVITAAATSATNISTLYPTAGTNSLADQLKIVAQLIAGGLQTKIYMVSMGGFDTHDEQIDSSGTTDKGTHANLLGQLSTAINAFQDDIKLLGIQDRVVGMTFSEFGRRIKSNASFGTDHGAAAPLFVFGTSVNPTIIGANPVISASVTQSDSLPMVYDFRSVYASLLKDWLGISDSQLTAILLRSFPTLPIIKSGLGLDEEAKKIDLKLSNYPNPFSAETYVNYFSPGGFQQLSLISIDGRINHVLFDGEFPQGERKVLLNLSHLSQGNYILLLNTSKVQSSINIQKE